MARLGAEVVRQRKTLVPVSVVGLFRSASGVGTSARLLANALEAAGEHVRRVDLSALYGQIDLSGSTDLIQQLPAKPGTTIVVVNGPEMGRAFAHLRPFRDPPSLLIAYWAWEASVFPSGWEKWLPSVDAVWCPSNFTTAAIRSQARETPVRTVPIPVPSAKDAKTIGNLNGPYRLLVVADARSSLDRKNVAASIEAFKSASSSVEATLTIKSQASEHLSKLINGDDRISVVSSHLSEPAMQELYRSHHALVSLHRAEGFGLPLAQMMAIGRPVVATRFSGNLQFMDDSCSLLVEAKVSEHNDSSGVYQQPIRWADADTGQAAEFIAKLAQEPTLSKALGEAAYSKVEHHLNPKRIGLMMISLASETLATRGSTNS